jgi:hypothetical protein
VDRNEAQFCRDEAARLLRLAQETNNPKLRADLVAMANGWLERARAKEELARPA